MLRFCPLLRRCLQAALATAVFPWAQTQKLAADFLREVYVDLSIGLSVPLSWRPDRIEYSLALPREAELVAIRVDVMLADSAEEQAIWEQGGDLAIRVPSIGLRELLSPGVTSTYVEVPLTETQDFRLELVDAGEFALRVVRTPVTSTGQGIYPDPARLYPPEGTLAGLSLVDSVGQPASMAWFTPRVSIYFASVKAEAQGVRLVATPNDPNAVLEWRLDGGKWDFLVSGLTSAPAAVSQAGWTLLQIRVSSSAVPSSLPPLLYQVAVARGALVCHPSCFRCSGPGIGDCKSCFPPLVLHGGRCLYTVCKTVGYYFNATSERCQKCHPTCLECSHGSQNSCTRCSLSRYMMPPSELATFGSCELSCPFGYFVKPTSQRCQRAPPSLKVERFYLRLALRVSLENFMDNPDTLKAVLRTAAQTLAVSPQDVRFHRYEQAEGGLGIYYYLEVENPFLKEERAEDWFSIERWFAALPVPVDDVIILSHTQLYPPGPRPFEVPFFEPWVWALIGAGSSSVLLLYPMYYFWFLRKYHEQHPYKPKTGKEEQFMERVLNKSDPNVISAMANSTENIKAAARAAVAHQQMKNAALKN